MLEKICEIMCGSKLLYGEEIWGTERGLGKGGGGYRNISARNR
jgi:hypothetical protein